MAYPSRDNQTQTHTKHKPDTDQTNRGVRRSRVKVWKPEDEGTPAFTKRKQSDLSWAKAHLPGEYPPYVVAAMDSVRISGEKTTAGAVMARLRAEGRDAASRVAREKSKGVPQGDDAA
jgi:hypothetical protein